MSIADLMPSNVPAELRVKVGHVMQRKRLSWRDAVLFLARKVVSPAREKARKTRKTCAHFSRPEGGFTYGAMGETNAEARRGGGKEAAR